MFDRYQRVKVHWKRCSWKRTSGHIDEADTGVDGGFVRFEAVTISAIET